MSISIKINCSMYFEIHHSIDVHHILGMGESDLNNICHLNPFKHSITIKAFIERILSLHYC